MVDAAVSLVPQSQTCVTFDAHPESYRHWKLSFDGTVATLRMDIDEEGGLQPGYKLKLNSYDLGVDIELHDALQRIRFEHPQVRCVVLTSSKERIFCSGANIFMLGQSSHAWKVNFCKFTNETRNGIEDSSRHSGLKFLAACNGTTAGGGYELALACDEILLIDDRSATVSLPEVPLLGVLPGTGGLTRLIDKRRVRHDHADLFCTIAEGVRAQRAKEWGLIDHAAKPQQFQSLIAQRAQALAQQSDRPSQAKGVVLTGLRREIDARGYHYSHVLVELDRPARIATVTIQAPREPAPSDLSSIESLGDQWWPLLMARELDDAILMLRINEPEVGTWLIKTRGDPQYVLGVDQTLATHATHWFVRETIGMLRRTLARLDVTSRSLFAVIDAGSCFAGTLLELALAADRSYMLSAPEVPQAPTLALSAMNFGAYETVAHMSRIATRFYGDPAMIQPAIAAIGQKLASAEAAALGLVTVTPDRLDWDDEIRLAVEERTSLSPDALTGMEASLRFGPTESMESRIFARLSAWQNWIFIRPNSVGETGALKVFGTGNKARFQWERI